ncbi:DNA processing protein [Anaerobacterium chartisolvens]|uniref:DNA processing protein n=1 Tax=Anaerobacterium chartisolvens TaxID=1297424 RepID=A0A369B745_9FIRM|nr:DNA-processing protein DprA [Anaerobacterium chartisolvens]RCX15504.1 DNA processing protein [Anaerobacterium chartisolvens]
MCGNIKYWIWLSSIPNIGPRRCSQMLERFGGPEEIWNMREADLKAARFLSAYTVENLLNPKYRNDAERLMDAMYRHGIKAIAVNNPSYPYYLKNIYNPPIVLYVRGRLNKDQKAVAVVGSRRASPYGMKMAEEIAYELSRLGIAVISGMARGIDTMAHRGCLKAGGTTIAVMGCGLDRAYPAENRELMESIAVSGAAVSEYPPGIPPLPQNFPARNRIISGISQGVVVIEAGGRSGSLITADFALEQGREVFAVPGNVDRVNSTGANKLIKDGAKMVTCVEDILEELDINRMASKIDKAAAGNFICDSRFDGLEGDEKEIVRCLEGNALHIDRISLKSGLGIQDVNSLLLMLELKGIIEQAPGRIYRLRI